MHLADQRRLHERLKEQGQIVLAIDGLQPDVGHEVLWVLCDCLSGEVLPARSLLSACETELASLLCEVQQALAVPVCGVISDGQHSLRKTVQAVLVGCAQLSGLLNTATMHRQAGMKEAKLSGRPTS